MIFEIKRTAAFKRALKKIKDAALLKELEKVIDLLAAGAALPPKFEDHALKGYAKNTRECHVRPDVLLIYRKDKNLLILTLVDFGSHSELFG